MPRLESTSSIIATVDQLFGSVSLPNVPMIETFLFSVRIAEVRTTVYGPTARGSAAWAELKASHENLDKVRFPLCAPKARWVCPTAPCASTFVAVALVASFVHRFFAPPSLPVAFAFAFAHFMVNKSKHYSEIFENSK
jgi:hypothetical protein